jgi:hypothetical protein
MQYIAKHADVLNALIKKYSTLDIMYPVFSHEEIYAISSAFTLECFFDFDAKKIIINENNLSEKDRFVLLYLKTMELIQICIDIYNEFERKTKEPPLIPLKNGIAFVGMNRSLKNVSNTIDPHAWDAFI